MSSIHTERRSDRRSGEGGRGNNAPDTTTDAKIQQGRTDALTRGFEQDRRLVEPEEIKKARRALKKRLKAIFGVAGGLTAATIAAAMGLDKTGVVDVNAIFEQLRRREDESGLSDPEIDEFVTAAIPATADGGARNQSADPSEGEIRIDGGEDEVSPTATDVNTIPVWTEDGLVEVPAEGLDEVDEQAEVDGEVLPITEVLVEENFDNYFRKLPYKSENGTPWEDFLTFAENLSEEFGYTITGFNEDLGKIVGELEGFDEDVYFEPDMVLIVPEGETPDHAEAREGLQIKLIDIDPSELKISPEDLGEHEFHNDFDNKNTYGTQEITLNVYLDRIELSIRQEISYKQDNIDPVIMDVNETIYLGAYGEMRTVIMLPVERILHDGEEGIGYNIYPTALLKNSELAQIIMVNSLFKSVSSEEGGDIVNPNVVDDTQNGLPEKLRDIDIYILNLTARPFVTSEDPAHHNPTDSSPVWNNQIVERYSPEYAFSAEDRGDRILDVTAAILKDQPDDPFDDEGGELLAVWTLAFQEFATGRSMGANLRTFQKTMSITQDAVVAITGDIGATVFESSGPNVASD